MTTLETTEQSDDSLAIWIQGHRGTNLFPFAAPEEVPLLLPIGVGNSSDIGSPIPPASIGANSPASTPGFWNPNTFNELMSDQAVSPIEEWSQLTSNWPEGADFEAFLATVRGAREELWPPQPA